ncbi:MAG TPA: cytochrome c biogenesis protein CcdC [Terracidiphilus sp.]|nr:cytochrome c biogenesis protein CcdC [Terracidiphilus sp.]
MLISPLGSAVALLLGMCAVIVWRVREAKTAVTLKKIVIPPLGMATGFSMFVAPPFRIPLEWAAIAFLVGATALAWPLVATTKLERRGNDVMMKRSRAFIVVILVLAAIRFAAHGYFDKIMTVEQTGGLFFVLAFGMIVVWRGKLVWDYKRVSAGIASGEPASVLDEA